MDKNTLWGLVLMGAIMFGFLYLSKPSEAEIAAERERSEQARAQTESKNPHSRALYRRRQLGPRRRRTRDGKNSRQCHHFLRQ